MFLLLFEREVWREGELEIFHVAFIFWKSFWNSEKGSSYPVPRTRKHKMQRHRCLGKFWRSRLFGTLSSGLKEQTELLPKVKRRIIIVFCKCWTCCLEFSIYYIFSCFYLSRIDCAWPGEIKLFGPERLHEWVGCLTCCFPSTMRFCNWFLQ